MIAVIHGGVKENNVGAFFGSALITGSALHNFAESYAMLGLIYRRSPKLATRFGKNYHRSYVRMKLERLREGGPDRCEARRMADRSCETTGRQVQRTFASGCAR